MPPAGIVGIRRARIARAGIETIQRKLRQQSIACRLAAQLAVIQIEPRFLQFRAILERVSNRILNRFGIGLIWAAI